MKSEWKEYTLGEITNWLSGATPTKNEAAYWGGDIPWISASSMKGSRYSDSELKITNKALENKSKLVPEETILLLVRGSALHKRIPVGITLRPVSFNQDVKAIRIKDKFLSDDIIDPWYLLYWFIEKKRFLLNLVENTGIGAGKFDTKQLQNLVITIPPKKEREKILQLIKILDDKIELNHKMNKTLEEMAQALFKSWFVDFDPVHAKLKAKESDTAQKQISQELGISKEVLDLFPDEFEESELGMIPKGWKVDKFKTLANIRKGLSYKGKHLSEDDDNTLMINLGCFGGNGQYLSKKIKYYDGDYKKSHVVNKGQLLFANTDMTQNRVILGSPIFAPDIAGNEMIFTHHVFAVDFLEHKMEEIYKYYIFQMLLSRKFRAVAEGYATGTTVLALPKNAVLNFNLLFSNITVVEKFNEYCIPIFNKITKNKNESLTLQKTRDTLLPKLLSGELDVSELELGDN